MAKITSIYRCQQCGATSPKWTGQCAVCKAWNTMVEEIIQNSKLKGQSSKERIRAGQAKVVRLSEVSGETKETRRVETGSAELDRVLGGGKLYIRGVLMA